MSMDPNSEEKGGLFVRLRFILLGLVSSALVIRFSESTSASVLALLSIVGAIALMVVAEAYSPKTYHCPYCKSKVSLNQGYCDCGAPVVSEREFSLDSIPVVLSPVKVLRGRGEWALYCVAGALLFTTVIWSFAV